MRLTTRTNLALRTLMVCAVNPDRIIRKSDVAGAINASENHLAQVVNQLGQAGFINTLRGRHGGFTLARPAEEISVGAVFRAFEAELPFMECMTSENTCPLKGTCRMSGHLLRAVEAFVARVAPIAEATAERDARERELGFESCRPTPAVPIALLLEDGLRAHVGVRGVPCVPCGCVHAGEVAVRAGVKRERSGAAEQMQIEVRAGQAEDAERLVPRAVALATVQVFDAGARDHREAATGRVDALRMTSDEQRFGFDLERAAAVSAGRAETKLRERNVAEPTASVAEHQVSRDRTEPKTTRELEGTEARFVGGCVDWFVGCWFAWLGGCVYCAGPFG